MPKQLKLTPSITAAIARSTDGSVDPETVAVYEARALSTLPVSKKYSLFDGATVTENTLSQMATFLNTGTNFVPLHTLHKQGYELPVGRVFQGEVMTENGVTELRTLFYVPKTETEIVNSLEAAVIDEVSVGLKTQHINCSECGFDYLGADAGPEHRWSLTCANGHVIGENGVHTLLSGMDKFLELSLVSLGAANNAKILSRAKSILGSEQYGQLAASGVQPEATILFSIPTHPKESSMDLTVLVADLTKAQAANLVNEATITANKTKIEALTASQSTLQAEVATLKAAADVKLPEVQAKLDETKASLDVAVSFVRAEADRLAVAAGLDKPAAEADFAALSASIEASKTKLSASLPVGGVSQPATAAPGAKAATQAASFKTR